jgi:hypothetical protein
MERKRTKQATVTHEQIINGLEIAMNSLRDALNPLGQLTEEKMQLHLEETVKRAREELQSAEYDLNDLSQGLKHPLVVISGDLKDYVPPKLDFQGTTEASTEEDGPRR